MPAPDDLEGLMKMISEQYGVRCDLGRVGEPKEIGPAIAFLGSKRNTYTTGANLNVDGGSAFF
jgi:NAD(P)-dependent dehydrogenase (short-subunit alcohol dehydrogenase family)